MVFMSETVISIKVKRESMTLNFCSMLMLEGEVGVVVLGGVVSGGVAGGGESADKMVNRLDSLGKESGGGVLSLSLERSFGGMIAEEMLYDTNTRRIAHNLLI